MPFDEQSYGSFFRSVNGPDPYDFQLDVARRLTAGENVVLRAPTGSGKTATVLTPFLYPGWYPRPARLIYALPLRTLAQSIYAEAKRMVKSIGWEPDGTVTIQTGEQPDDPFFDRGMIIVTTYDQILSGLLLGPYGLPDKLHNVNAAAVVGALVVFDEFHLMESHRAFLTGAAGLYLFRGLTQSVWMTATATPTLVDTLCDSLPASCAGPSETELASLSCVSTVARRLVWEAEPLSPTAIAKHLSGRVLVVANTVRHAQQLFADLTDANPSIPAMLLHSRFFQSHRREKERALHGMFGKGSRGPALLVATQVVEAGVDITCDHLHTELAPMNSLVQRAGRCARFKNESGTVHIHPLPDEPRAWLPYGDLKQPDVSLARTQRLLEADAGQGTMLSPALTSRWVALVHEQDDAQALAAGWRERFSDILTQIRQTAIARQPSGVARFIREPDDDDVRVILSHEANLPVRYGQRESLTLNRWRLAALLNNAREQGCDRIGWYWEPGEQAGWRALDDERHLAAAFVVAVDPAFVRYTESIGLEEGRAGNQESPLRTEPPRPGHKPLHAELWTAHVRAVADHTQRRISPEDGGSWLSARFGQRFGFPAAALLEAARVCGLAHDLGKLQLGWQRWAGEMQSLHDPGYKHLAPLAHTDFDSADPSDRQHARDVTARRPDHSAAGAYLAIAALHTLHEVPAETRPFLASACSAAILGHHGGWLQSEGARRQDLGIQHLWPDARKAISEVFSTYTWRAAVQLMSVTDRHGTLQTLLDLTVGDEALMQWWPLVAYLTRTLRLSDQRATEEGGKSD